MRNREIPQHPPPKKKKSLGMARSVTFKKNRFHIKIELEARF